ncbi:uncharacterized protein [Gossypium hirsutum]|uniref:Retrovirus-related Pol polyprotein from transposon TNT 1-94 n=1 Tax=Gossypium hirsutum TaxID=3635 RepID=A0A1U8HW85_GOSHI|nr:uncharacterized protein LOC107887897 [Gossypium hirsutum]
MTQNLKLSKNDSEKLYDPSIYRSIVGSLLYLTAMRLDLMFPATMLSMFIWELLRGFSEYIVAMTTANQAIWLRNLLFDLGFEQESVIVLLCDNKSAISITENPV